MVISMLSIVFVDRWHIYCSPVHRYKQAAKCGKVALFHVAGFFGEDHIVFLWVTENFAQCIAFASDSAMSRSRNDFKAYRDVFRSSCTRNNLKQK